MTEPAASAGDRDFQSANPRQRGRRMAPRAAVVTLTDMRDALTATTQLRHFYDIPRDAESPAPERPRRITASSPTK